MTRTFALSALAVLLIACGQKAEQQAATPAGDAAQTTTEAKTDRQSPPRPAIRQSDARVWIDPVVAAKGTSGSFKVHYYGVEASRAMVIPLTVPQGMMIDSISYAGSMLEYIGTRPTRIDNETHILLFTAIPTTEPDIPAKEGVLATIHFTLQANAASGMIEETFIPPGNYLTYVDTASALVEPQFEPGKVTVQ